MSLITYFAIFVFSNALANEVNIFSARHYDSDVQLYEKFTAKTGIQVNVVSGKSGALEKRIIEEGSDSEVLTGPPSLNGNEEDFYDEDKIVGGGSPTPSDLAPIRTEVTEKKSNKY